MTHMRLIRLSLLLLLVVLLAAAASPQSIPVTAKSRQSQDTDRSVCPEPSIPQAVSAQVNLCVDRLVDA
ncbi:MAG: hypothetical protein WAM65_04375, partial [Candidatus Korobacteraceae bacterium]